MTLTEALVAIQAAIELDPPEVEGGEVTVEVDYATPVGIKVIWTPIEDPDKFKNWGLHEDP